jgi:PiT family inorganic phosphate transporter
MGKGIIDPSAVDSYLILIAVLSGIIWTAIATHLGLPISVSHSLIGGMIGAAFAKVGTKALIFKGIAKTVIFIFMAPIIGFFFGIFFIIIATWIVKNHPPSKIDKYFRVFQLFSAASYSLGHGTNDAQKTMGIIAILLYTNGMLGDEFYVPFWVVITCHLFIALGTLVGGWAVIKTLGMKITKLRPIDGFAAETASALTLFGTAYAGIPVSTTHTITGAIVGVGSTKRLSAVRWGVAGNVVLAWIFTIPSTFFISFLLQKIFF